MPDWSEEKPTIDLLKSMVTMTEVVELLGWEIDNHGKITSPWNPDERTPSCHVYDDHVFDFSTGNHADIIDLVQLVTGDRVGHAIYRLWNKALRAGLEPGDAERQPVREVVDFTEDLRYYGPVDMVRWGALLPPSNCRDDGYSLLIPHADEDGVYGVKTRGLDGVKGAWPGSQFTKRLYSTVSYSFFGLQYRIAVITEGESDSWHVMELMYDKADVFALPSGASSWKDSWLKDLEPYDKVIVIMDNDRAGRDARDKLSRKIGFDRVKDVFVPQLFNDVREAVLAGWDGKAILDAV